MAVFKTLSNPKPIELKKFLGINESVGLTQLKVGEALEQVNFRVTQDYKLEKRKGHKVFHCYNTGKKVQGLWHGFLNDKEIILSANDGKIYEYDFDTETNTQIGTMTDAPTKMFYFQDKVYFINGHEYKEYDGEYFLEVEGYIPTIAIATPPAGGGTDYEDLNLLTGKKKQEFIGDGTSKEFVLREAGIDSILTVTINLTPQTPDKYTVDKTTGKLTFSIAPADQDLVTITWNKPSTATRELVCNNKCFMLYGVSNDTSVFLWGNPNQKNRRTWSGTLKADYFPTYNFTHVGSNEYGITDIVSVYDRQIIFKEDRTHYSVPEYNDHLDKYDYPVYELNYTVGNIACGQVQLVDNSPIAIHNKSWYHFKQTQVKDERNAVLISERLRETLDGLDLSTAITFDFQRKKEYWCNVGDKVYIWNYGNNTMYMYDNISATEFLDVNNKIFFSTVDEIRYFEGEDDEIHISEEEHEFVPVKAYMILGFNDWDSFEMRKNSREMYVSLLPATHTSVNISFRTNRLNDFKPLNKPVEYLLFNFDDINFDLFTFLTNEAPQTFRRKYRAKKYTYIQFKFENKTINESCTLLALKIQADTMGFERR